MLCRDWNAIKLKNSNSCVNCKSNQAFNDLLINGVTFTSTNTLYCITINIYDLRHNIYIYRHISCSLFITFTPYTHSLRMSFTAFGLVFSLPCFVLLTIFSAQCRDFFFLCWFFVVWLWFCNLFPFHYIHIHSDSFPILLNILWRAALLQTTEEAHWCFHFHTHRELCTPLDFAHITRDH